jgi:hypothetical protein
MPQMTLLTKSRALDLLPPFVWLWRFLVRFRPLSEYSIHRLGQVNRPVALDALTAIAQKNDLAPFIRFSAVEQLANRDVDIAARLLIETLERNHYVDRAASLLRRYRRPEVLAALHAALEGPSVCARKAAAESLAVMADPSSVPHLCRYAEKAPSRDHEFASESVLLALIAFALQDPPLMEQVVPVLQANRAGRLLMNLLATASSAKGSGGSAALRIASALAQVLIPSLHKSEVRKAAKLLGADGTAFLVSVLRHNFASAVGSDPNGRWLLNELFQQDPAVVLALARDQFTSHGLLHRASVVIWLANHGHREVVPSETVSALAAFALRHGAPDSAEALKFTDTPERDRALHDQYTQRGFADDCIRALLAIGDLGYLSDETLGGLAVLPDYELFQGFSQGKSFMEETPWGDVGRHDSKAVTRTVSRAEIRIIARQELVRRGVESKTANGSHFSAGPPNTPLQPTSGGPTEVG